MMFLLDSGVMLGLIALSLGVILLVWALRNEGRGVGLAKFFGWIVIISAIFSISCSTYYGFKYWNAGYFQKPMSMMQSKSVDGENRNP
jgi:hypothetical protein